MKGKKKKKIVFVCTGNTCRSPMAELLFQRKVAELGLTGLEVCSAGVKAAVGETMNEKSAQVLMDKGFEPHSFVAKQIDEKLLKESLAIVCMTDGLRDLVMEMRWNALREAGEEEIENNVYSFSELTGYEILDPYGRDIDCYRYVYELLAGGMSALTDKLLPPSVRKNYVAKPKTPKKPTTGKTAKKTAKTSAVKKPRKSAAKKKNTENM